MVWLWANLLKCDVYLCLFNCDIEFVIYECNVMYGYLFSEEENGIWY